MTRKLERLVEETYRDLAPSGRVGQELLTDLPVQRSRRRSAWPWAAAAVLMAGLGWFVLHARGEGAGDGDVSEHAAEEGGAALTLPTVPRPRRGVVAPSKKDYAVRIAHGSVVSVRGEDGWERVTLAELEKRVAGFAQGTRPVLHVDHRVPWVHVQWVANLCGLESRSAIAFAVRDAKGREFLLDGTRPRARIGVTPCSVYVSPDGAQPRYRSGRKGFAGVEDLLNHLRGVRRGEPKRPGKISAGVAAGFGFAAAAWTAFLDAGFEKIELDGLAQRPPREARTARVLPYPKAVTHSEVLLFEAVEEGVSDLARTVKILRRRFGSAGLDRVEVERVRDGKGVLVTVPAGTDRDRIRQLVERRGVLSMHITIEPGSPRFVQEWQRRVDKKKPGKGVRWYELAGLARKTYGSSRPEWKHPFALVRLDTYEITGASLRDVEVRQELADQWVVIFKVRKAHQGNMAELTRERGSYLAIVIDDRVHAAPVLNDVLSSSGQISGGFAKADATVLAALLQSEPLPVRLRLAVR